jgi:hypothetical protein
LPLQPFCYRLGLLKEQFWYPASDFLVVLTLFSPYFNPASF